LVNCTLAGNVANYGAGMYNRDHSDPSLTECRFADNHAESWGGGMYNAFTSSPILDDCIFTGNQAYKGAGACDGDTVSNPVLTNCTFSSNRATWVGGGIWTAGSGPQLAGCTFVDNIADDGGGMYIEGGSPALSDCVFMCNSAGDNGGGVYAGGGAAELTNCLFTGNATADRGGALYNDLAQPVLSNCTITRNEALETGGIRNHYSHPTLTDCIVWANDHTQMAGGSPTVTYSCIEGGWDGEGNIPDCDPLFVPGPAGCYYLSQLAGGQSQDSDCVDLGSGASGELGMDTRTTRSDEGGDTGMVDLGYHYPITGQPWLMGDFDHSGGVDLRDFAHLQKCFTRGNPTEKCSFCCVFDFDFDTDVDLSDHTAFSLQLTGP
jgi:hypothetical protein